MSGTTTTPPAGTAPGQVQNLATGTPTDSTIPVSYTAPATGSPVTTYDGQTSTDNVVWTGNSGAFTATGGTFIGLTASSATTPSAYYLRIVATNGYGASTTEYPTAVTMAVNPEESKSFDELVVDAITAIANVLNDALGGLRTSGVTATRASLAANLSKMSQAATALADQVAAPQTDSGGNGS